MLVVGEDTLEHCDCDSDVIHTFDRNICISPRLSLFSCYFESLIQNPGV